MARKFTYEHPPGSGQNGCERTFEDDYVLESNRGPIRADTVVVGDMLQTTPRYKTRILVVEVVS